MDPELVDQLWTAVVSFGAAYGFRIVGALLALLLGWIISKIVLGLVRKALSKKGVEASVGGFVNSALNMLALVLVIVAALSVLGIETTSFAAVLGAAGLAIGMAMKDSLANFASSVMVIAFKPFVVGDVVNVAGQEGKVSKIEVFATTLLTVDNRTIIVGNGAVTNGPIINFTKQGTRRLNITLGIGYDDSIKDAKELVLKLLKEEERVMTEPAPNVFVAELADSSVNLGVHAWVKAADFAAVNGALLEKMKLACDEQGISIPFPQRDVHHYQEDKAA